jgi:hypothetical protein
LEKCEDELETIRRVEGFGKWLKKGDMCAEWKTEDEVRDEKDAVKRESGG